MRLPLSAALVALVAHTAFAQGGTSPATQDLSLEQAIALARQNNPTYLGTVTGRRTADAEVRSAYGAFLPTLSSSFSAGYQQAGSQVFQGLTFTGSSDAVTSHYSLGLNYSLSMSSFIQPRLQKANRAATEANITGQAEVLRANVTAAYLGALGVPYARTPNLDRLARAGTLFTRATSPRKTPRLVPNRACASSWLLLPRNQPVYWPREKAIWSSYLESRAKS